MDQMGLESITMSELNETPRRYRWPWLVAAAIALGTVLAVAWVAVAARNLKRERDVNGPLPNSAPAR
jgi:hypothetical protein